MNILRILFLISGLFTLTAEIKPFKLGFLTYATKRSDVQGVARGMNHCASFVLVTIGCLDLFCLNWFIGSAEGKYVCLWIGAWWFIRSFSQFYLGHRKGDWMIFFGFSAIGILHLLLIFNAF